MPNVRDLATADARAIIQNDAGLPIVLINENGEFSISGTYSDIGSLVDPVTGEPVQGRAIETTISALDAKEKMGKIPARGNKARIKTKDDKDLLLFIQRVEYDRTIELCRITLGLQLSDKLIEDKKDD